MVDLLNRSPGRLGVSSEALQRMIEERQRNPGGFLANLAQQARDEPLETASASGIPVVSDLADARLAGQSIGKAWREPSKLNLLEAGTNVGLAAMPFLGIGMFGGLKSAKAPTGLLPTAKRMMKEGVAPEHIWEKTGWFQGPDQLWRWEIDDSAAKLDLLPLAQQKAGDKDFVWASDTLKHPELYEAYPPTKDIEISTHKSGSSAAGSYQPGGYGLHPGISLRSGDSPKMRSTMLHEMQHAIQDIEGFATGGNTIGLRPKTPAWDIYQERLQAIVTPPSLQEFTEMGRYDSIEAARPDWLEHVKTLEGYKKKGIPDFLDRAAQETAVSEAYRRSAGEVEARAVQKRADYSPEMRRSWFPGWDYDIPVERQIVRRR